MLINLMMLFIVMFALLSRLQLAAKPFGRVATDRAFQSVEALMVPVLQRDRRCHDRCAISRSAAPDVAGRGEIDELGPKLNPKPLNP